MEPDLDFTKLRYVLYARKSTDDPQQQVRSVDDQITECEKFADRMGLNIVDRLREKESAKKPGKRPIFSQMLNDIRANKYDAILSWNPDRLARNMKEGGEIIDMVDENILKDLKFVTMHFSKDPNGKMLLGMAFVLSKQYSDKLSVDVKRGMARKFEEGKSHTPKHGYFFDENGIYHPDGQNFELIQEGWAKRLQGTSLEEISLWLNERGYKKTTKSSGRQILMNEKILSEIFHDPFYYGILYLSDGRSVNLKAAYNFIPAISEEEYNQVQALSQRRLKPFNTKRRITFYPLRSMIICSFCGKNMVVGPSTSGSKEKKRYLNYRCDNENCTRPKRSIRANIVFDYIYQILEKLKFTDKDYNLYYNALGKLTDQRRERLATELHSLEGALKAKSNEIKQRSLDLIGTKTTPTVQKANEDYITQLEVQSEEIQNEITKLKSQLVSPEVAHMTLDQFLNLSNRAADVVKAGSPVTKDAICRLIFLNLIAGVDEMKSYQAKPPFDEMLKVTSIVSGANERN